jgi:multidrug efflux pump subunit AcrA (membrane-fusion protein)
MKEREERDAKTKRRDTIKNFTIVFLLILLALTLFSNTIMNFSLPEVATVYVQSGTINTRIRGSGAVTAEDPYNVVAKESRKVASVAVRAGDEVEKDAVLYYLEETESLELQQAEAALEELERAYMQTLFSGTISSTVINNVEAGIYHTFDDFKDEITRSYDSVRVAENAILARQQDIEEAQKHLVSLGVEMGGIFAPRDELFDRIKEVEAYVLYNIRGIIEAYGGSKPILASEAISEAQTKSQLSSLFAMGRMTQEQFEASSNAYEMTIKRYYDIQNELTRAITAAQDALGMAQNAMREAEERLTRANEAHTRLTNNIQAEINFANQKQQIEAKKEEIEKLRSNAGGSTITAPVAGTVTSMSFVAGETVQLESTVAVIQVAGKGFTLSFSVTNEQAAKVQVGDPAESQNSWWWYDDLSIVLTSIRPDTGSQGQMKQLIFAVSGSSVQAGQQLNVSVGQRSSNYDLTVPNSAVRQDSNGTFVLILETRVTPLNNRYFATRCDVEIVAQDENNTAISAPLYGWEYVITTSTTPLSPGQQVRLTN